MMVFLSSCSSRTLFRETIVLAHPANGRSTIFRISIGCPNPAFGSNHFTLSIGGQAPRAWQSRGSERTTSVASGTGLTAPTPNQSGWRDSACAAIFRRGCPALRQGEQAMTLAINDVAPNFEAETTEGRIRFH